MACCSNRRHAASAPRLRAAAPPAGTAHGGEAVRALVYGGRQPLALRGPFSGRVYRVGPADRAVEADARDADALVRSGLFTPAS